MKVVPQVRGELELALDFVDAAIDATQRLPRAEGAALRLSLTVARDGLTRCHATVGDVVELGRAVHTLGTCRACRGARAAALTLRCVVLRLRLRWGRMRPAQGQDSSFARLDLLFGTRAIARYIGVTRKQGRALVSGGAIPTFDLAGVTCARRSNVRQHVRLMDRVGRG